MRTRNWLLFLTSIGLVAGLATSCGSKKSKSEDTPTTTTEPGSNENIVIAGQLSLTSSAALNLTADTPALTDLSVYCVTFSLPPVAGKGTLDAEGKFNIELGASNSSVGCFILKGEDVLGSIVFEDPAKKDLAGGNKTGERHSFAGGSNNLGAIAFDLNTGKAVVDVTKIVSTNKRDTTAATAAAVDFTGSYTMTSAGLTLPAGYSGSCPPRTNNQDGGDDCRGPTEGEKLFVKSVKGARTDGSPAYAMMLWQSEALFNTCGPKLGFSYEQGKKFGIDFSGSGIPEGAFSWDSSLGEGWKSADARASNTLMNMENVDSFKGLPGTKQFFKQYRSFNCQPGKPCTEGDPIVEAGFQFNANTKDSGCRVDGKPERLDDWRDMTCTNERLTGASEGLNKNTCTKTSDSKTYTCVNITGTFKTDGTPITNAHTRFPDDYDVLAYGNFCDKNSNGVMDGNEWPEGDHRSPSCSGGITLTKGKLCSEIVATTDAGKLAQLRCYMEHANNSDKEGESNVCRRDVRGNWSAKTPAEFLGSSDKPARPRGLHVLELFDYDSATSGSLTGEDTEFRGIRVGDNWTDCQVNEIFSLALRKLPDSNDLLVEMVQTERNVSPKPACVAEYGEGKVSKSMFKMVKN